jgi:hypothetical protein
MALTLLLAQPAMAKLYKWVDEKGKTHYTDKLPPEQAQKSRSELNTKGVEINRVDRAKTPEEVAREKELERLRKERERLIEKQKAEDRVLLRTFRSEDDIIMAMEGKLTAIDVMIGITKSNINQAKLQLANMQSSAANQERMGRKPSEKLLQDIANTRKQLKNNYASIINREKDKEALKQKTEADLKRFRELQQLKTKRPSEIKRKVRASQLDHVVPCSTTAACDAYWEKGKKYALKHATTKLELTSDSVIMTAAPKQDNGISITLSRISTDGDTNEHIFFDLQCKDSKKGKDFCKGEKVQKIKNGFKSYVLDNSKNTENKQ